MGKVVTYHCCDCKHIDTYDLGNRDKVRRCKKCNSTNLFKNLIREK